ncbi:hypothetical protein ACFQY9_06735 [Microvirga aerilata]|uniref:hypothetical protein n=1 Tax=Microvirga aerilata TaxID=670292 RepID=UPI00362EEFB9
MLESFILPTLKIDVPELENEGSVKHLVREGVRAFVHVHCADDEEVLWPLNTGRHIVDHFTFGVNLKSGSFHG